MHQPYLECRWSKGTAVLPTDKSSTIEIRPNDILKSKREEEVDQSEEKETVEEHLDDDATGGVSGRIKIIADATNETESESLENIRLTNGRPKDDASSDFLEISEDENQTDATIRSLGAAHSDDWLSDKNPDQVIYKEIVTDAQHSLDFAFAAGTSATTMCTA